MKKWADDDPKAALMTRKRAVLLEAALQAFLKQGYAESSVNRIAESAGVSIKTLYRHFEDKDDLFNAVMTVACAEDGRSPDADAQSSSPEWFDEPPQVALPKIGNEYLRHILSDHHLALYRVVIRDAGRFPELGQRFRQQVLGREKVMLVRYLNHWSNRLRWKIADVHGAVEIFGALLKADLFEAALFGSPRAAPRSLGNRARRASLQIISLFESGRL